MILNSISRRSIALGAKLRFPSIKFRYGAARDNKTSAAASSGASSQSKQQQSGEVIYDFQLPLRFRRRPMDQEEIDYINRGGPA